MSLLNIISDRNRDPQASYLISQDVHTPTYRWLLNETSGITAVDDIAANNGTYVSNSGGVWTGGTLAQPGPWPSARAPLFNAAGYVKTFTTQIWNGESSFTFEALVYRIGTGRMGIAGTRQSNGFNGIGIRIGLTSAGQIEPYVTAGGSIDCGGTNIIPATEWAHFAMAYTQSATSYIYLNGVQVGSGNMGNHGVSSFLGGIGVEQDAQTSTAWNGRLWGVTVYNTHLTQAQILSHVKAGRFAN